MRTFFDAEYTIDGREASLQAQSNKNQQRPAAPAGLSRREIAIINHFLRN